MALSSGITERHDVPGEPGEWMEFRQLGFAALIEAQQAATERTGRYMRAVGPDNYERLISRPRETTRAGDPFLSHDTATLLQYGLVRWSYPAELPLPADRPEVRRIRAALIADLDAKTAEWAARTVLELSGVDNARGDAPDAIEVTPARGERRFEGMAGLIQETAEEALTTDPSLPS